MAQEDIVGKIIDFESGEMEEHEVIEFFAELIKNGMAWSLQGSYGRQAEDFIDAGVISPKGEIDWEMVEDNQ